MPRRELADAFGGASRETNSAFSDRFHIAVAVFENEGFGAFDEERLGPLHVDRRRRDGGTNRRRRRIRCDGDALFVLTEHLHNLRHTIAGTKVDEVDLQKRTRSIMERSERMNAD